MENLEVSIKIKVSEKLIQFLPIEPISSPSLTNW